LKQENTSRQDAKAQRNPEIPFHPPLTKGEREGFEGLGVLCVFARVIFFRFDNSKTTPI
jgi:hypothetical protein